jgi:redox-sensing transcriptional repressor
VAGLFDIEPSLLGSRIRGVAVNHLDDFETVAAVDPPAMGVIATPASAAQDVCDRMVRAGVGSVLNFAPRVLTVPPHVLLRYVDLNIELQVMSFYLSHRDHPGSAAASSHLPHAVGLTSAEPG